MFSIERHVVGSYRTNCYVLTSAGQALVIDPGDEGDLLIRELGDAHVSRIVLTHCHSDHIGAVNELVERYGATRRVRTTGSSAWTVSSTTATRSRGARTASR